MKKSQTCRVLAIFGILAAAPLVFGFTSNRVSHYADGCVHHMNRKESEKTLRKREKATLANLQARDFALAFRGHTR
jgi:hypothetical protein